MTIVYSTLRYVILHWGTHADQIVLFALCFGPLVGVCWIFPVCPSVWCLRNVHAVNVSGTTYTLWEASNCSWLNLECIITFWTSVSLSRKTSANKFGGFTRWRRPSVCLFVCLFVHLFVCRLWILWSNSLGGSAWRQAGVYRIHSDTFVVVVVDYIIRPIIIIIITRVNAIYLLFSSYPLTFILLDLGHAAPCCYSIVSRCCCRKVK